MIGSEPTAVAIRGGEVQAAIFGAPAFEAAAEDPEFHLRRPIAGGEIVDPAAARWLINHAMIRAAGRQRIFKPDVVIARDVLAARWAAPGLLEAALWPARAPPTSSTRRWRRRWARASGSTAPTATSSSISARARPTSPRSRWRGRSAAGASPGTAGGASTRCIADTCAGSTALSLDAATVEEVIASLARVGPHEERRLEVSGRGDGGEKRHRRSPRPSLPACLDSARPHRSSAALDAVLADTPARFIADIKREGILLCGRRRSARGAGRCDRRRHRHRGPPRQPAAALRGARDRLRARQPRRPQARPDVHPLRTVRLGRNHSGAGPTGDGATTRAICRSPASSGGNENFRHRPCDVSHSSSLETRDDVWRDPQCDCQPCTRLSGVLLMTGVLLSVTV